MLNKLMRYENKALSKTVLPLGIGVLLISVFATVMLKLEMLVSGWESLNSSASAVIQTGSITLFVISVIAIVSASFVSLFLIMQRYYKNLFSDEGYLTFTLPVSVNQIVISKMLSAILWMLYAVVCVAAGAFVIVLFGSSESFLNHDVLAIIKEFFSLLSQFEGSEVFHVVLYVLEFILLFFIEQGYSILLIYLAITLGNQIAKKHKIVSAVLMYFVISSICTTLITVFTVIFGISGMGVTVTEDTLIESNLFGAGHAFFWIYILIYAAFGAALYFINCRILRNKLNLE